MQVYLSLGSNIEPRLTYLQNAILLIEQQIGQVQKISNIYQTAPWHCAPSHDDYLNLTLCVETILKPELLIVNCLNIETVLGRDRTDDIKNIYLPRTIDIDILLIEENIIHQEQLIVPHPRMHLRRFVLAPLAEIASEIVHPILKDTIANLLSVCVDTSPVSVLQTKI